MAISWDYMAGVKATAAGQKAAAEQNRATQQNYANSAGVHRYFADPTES